MLKNDSGELDQKEEYFEIDVTAAREKGHLLHIKEQKVRK